MPITIVINTTLFSEWIAICLLSATVLIIIAMSTGDFSRRHAWTAVPVKRAIDEGGGDGGEKENGELIFNRSNMFVT